MEETIVLRAKIERAKAKRDQLNRDIENMIDELCRRMLDLPLADRVELMR